MVHIHWAKTLDIFENQHCSSLSMRISSTQLLIFALWPLLRPFFQAGAFKFSSVGALNTLINLNHGFYDSKHSRSPRRSKDDSRHSRSCSPRDSKRRRSRSLSKDRARRRQTESFRTYSSEVRPDDRVVEEVDTEEGVSKQVYQDFREALKSTKGVVTTLDREDKDTGGVTETSSTDKPDRIAWGSQQSLTRALQYTARLTQGVSSTAKVVETPLADCTAQEYSFRFLKPAVVFLKEAFWLRVDPVNFPATSTTDRCFIGWSGTPN